MDSQKWPIENYQDIPSIIWRHKLVFYIPKQISYDKALLYVNGGKVVDEKGQQIFSQSKESIDFAGIAIKSNIPVIELQDVPNQYLFFNNEPIKEDEILAYTYKKVIENPEENAYLAGHLPMAKAAVKAMDAVQEILQTENNLRISGFVLSGASKRGWAVWLATLQDKRVKAIVPIVVDILNTRNSILHICRSYCGVCPLALKDYERHGIVGLLNTNGSHDLMRIEDPYSYLDDPNYRERLAIPKYLINASGDDFFVPDCSRWYFQDLPGKNNYIRYMPNAMHYFVGNAFSNSTASLKSINEGLKSYLHFILNKIALPKVSWKFSDKQVDVSSSLRPEKVILWYANNEAARDFRFLSCNDGYYDKIRLGWKSIVADWLPAFLQPQMCDNCYFSQDVEFSCPEERRCEFQVALPEFKQGWRAAFVELHYNIANTPFVITTEVDIFPDVMPEQNGKQEL